MDFETFSEFAALLARLREDELAAVQRRDEAARRVLDASRRCIELGVEDSAARKTVDSFLRGGVP